MTLFDRVFSGNDAVFGLTEGAIDGAIAQYGEDKAVSFPNTAYSLPCYYAVTGTKVTTLKELKEALGVVKTLMTREKRLNDAFMSGVATALCAEFIEVLKYIDGATPYEEPCYGHLADAVIRELGVPLVTGDIPGVAVILGSAPTVEEGVALVKSYQAQGILVTLVGGIIDQVAEAGMKTGANVRVIPLGKDVTAVIHVVSVALRAALIFGNVTPGDAGTLMKYTMDRVPAFVNAFKPLDDVIVACGAGAIALGFPVITNETENIFRVPKSLIVQEDVSKFNATSLEARDIKIKITNIDIPVAFASAFEGEIIRRKDMQVEFDGSRVDCAELVQTCDASEVEDHKITVVGPEVDDMELGSKNSIAYVVKVAGKNMQPDFEPVIERKFHNYINCIEGVYHTGQRDMQRIRISIDAFNAGFKIKHIGEVLYASVKNEFDAVVDKCEVVIYTDPAECTRVRHEVAIPIFDKRDEMKKDLDRVDAREAVFAENVKAKFGNQKLMYLRVTDNDIRYYAYGHFGYLYDTYHFNRAETFNPDDMFQVIDPDKLKDINPDLLIVQADSQELLDNKLKNNPVWSSLKAVQNNKVIYADYSTYMLGFGIVSQEAIMKQISDEWGLN